MPAMSGPFYQYRSSGYYYAYSPETGSQGSQATNSSSSSPVLPSLDHDFIHYESPHCGSQYSSDSNISDSLSPSTVDSLAPAEYRRSNDQDQLQDWTIVSNPTFAATHLSHITGISASYAEAVKRTDLAGDENRLMPPQQEHDGGLKTGNLGGKMWSNAVDGFYAIEFSESESDCSVLDTGEADATPCRGEEWEVISPFPLNTQ